MQHFSIRRLDARELIEQLELCIVVPVLNEADNVDQLVERAEAALTGIDWEIIFVDDGSTDGTPDRIASIAALDRRVRLIRRVNRRGLSSAVIEGMLATTAPVVAVMDGDLQHDENLLPDLYRSIAHDGYDVAVGTRYGSGGAVKDWDDRRERISALATRLAAAITPTPLTDPMSGFFAIRQSCAIERAPRVSGMGYKILLDLLSSSQEPLRVTEHAYTFRGRQHGSSKLDSMVALQYLEMLIDKRIGRFVPLTFLKFAAVGTLGLLVHLAMLAAMLRLGAGFAASQSVAVLSAIAFNFVLNNNFTYRDRRLKGWRFFTGLLSFYLICGAGAVANVGVGELLFSQRQDWWIAGVAGAMVGAVWNFAMGSVLTWKRGR